MSIMNHKTSGLNAHDSVFDRNSPRPPVPGEERTHCVSDWSGLPMEYPSKPRRKLHSIPNECSDAKPIASSTSSSSSQRQQNDNQSPPSCLRWAVSLHCLLEDPDGVELFKRFLQAEDNADALDFWFACEGLRKQQEPDRIQQLVKVIYRRYFLKSTLPISEDIKREVGRCLKASQRFLENSALFDEAQTQVEHLISESTYPNFLKSELYLHYIQSVQNPVAYSGEFSSESSSSSSSVSNKDLASLACGGDPLPIIHEDKEFHHASSYGHVHTPGVSTGYQTPTVVGSMRLTRDMLLATQKNRAMDVRPQTEAFAADMYRGTGLHLAYNSYNPVSRQDSEMQSISSHSDARTESDNMSLNDSSVDGRSVHRAHRRKSSMEARLVRQSAAINKETHMHQTLIPRTQRIDKQNCKPLRPEEFAAVLIQKLETLKRSQDKYELFERKLTESDSLTSLNDKGRVINEQQSRELANAIREKLQLEDDNCQQILDDHVSIVFSDNTSHALSPGVVSPRPHSPRKWQGMRTRRKDKDVFSTFSGDSGNVHDFGDEHKMVKSKSMPDYPEDRFTRGSTSRRSSSKKALTEYTDSGVSVVSDTPPDHRVLSWLKDSERGYRTSSYTHSEMSGTKHSRHRSLASSTLPSNLNRHRKGYGSRSNSLERSGVPSPFCPAQPFVADPNMPPLPQPNTTVQLEEAIRRLKEDDIRTRTRQNVPSKQHFTIAVFSFCDEQFPYRMKIPGKQITLKQFKEYLPKRGNYRYFFKTECEELDNQIIQEEVINDMDVLPLWEGRINAQVKAID